MSQAPLLESSGWGRGAPRPLQLPEAPASLPVHALRPPLPRHAAAVSLCDAVAVGLSHHLKILGSCRLMGSRCPVIQTCQCAVREHRALTELPPGAWGLRFAGNQRSLSGTTREADSR